MVPLDALEANEPSKAAYIESNRLLNELCEARSQMIGKLQIERDNFWKACEQIRQEALETEARKDEQIALLHGAIRKIVGDEIADEMFRAMQASEVTPTPAPEEKSEIG